MNLFQEIKKIIQQVFGLTRDVEAGKVIDDQHSAEIKKLQEDMRRLAATVERYHYEQELNRQQTASDLKNALLQIEIMLLKSERLLPPAPKDKAEKPEENE